MSLGALGSTGVLIWVVVLVGAGALALRSRSHALRQFGERAFKERRAALIAYLLPLAGFVASVVFVGFGESAHAAGELGATAEPSTWRNVSLVSMLASAVASMVSCALMVLGMLRRTTDGRVLLGDVGTAVLGLVSLWGVAANYPPIG